MRLEMGGSLLSTANVFNKMNSFFLSGLVVQSDKAGLLN